MSHLKDERRELQARYKRLKALSSHEASQERATISEMLRECDSKILIEKATQWGIEVRDKPDWYSQKIDQEGGVLTLFLPYLNQTATAILTHRIRKARMAYWKGWAEVLVTILSLLVAILALMLKR
jgi:hypothetical protein